eukprot:TRINITY_DN1191_c0_g1_i1.p1 TRINITY_DN1191_c0_g1~~TRINITY_DN1191_c0_g1_i1.p1  ORF type:complete len:857 (-),score=275.17 TRINITY_DN1191_c0_g1_i1:59-2320(-)
MGACAYKTFELDEFLGGGPVQYREVQGHESSQFLSLFKGGVQYLEGGVASAFKKVDRDKFDARLLHCKGARHVRVHQVPLSADSLNEGDVFILDLGRKIIQWNGADSSRKEKMRGMDVSRKIKDEERGGKATFALIDAKEAPVDPEEEKLFWETLGGKKKVKSASEGGSDEHFEEKSAYLLFRVSDASGKLEITEVGRSPKLSKDLLDSNDCFILDAGSEIFTWIGKGATKQERKESMITAQSFLKSQKKPDWTPISRCVEGAETPLFKSKFQVWKEPPQKAGMPSQEKGPGYRTETAVESARKAANVDIGALTRSTSQAEKLVDDGSGDLKVWRIQNFKMVDVPKPTYGQFFSGDSYVLLYSYGGNPKAGKEHFNHIIYFWQGSSSSTDEKSSAALHAKELDDSMGGTPVQVRVVQNKEPDHFLQLFKGKMIIHEGGCASGFKNLNDKDVYDTDGVSLFHVRGTNSLNTRAVQVAEKAGSLNSGDVFVLLTPDTMFVWEGKGSNAEEKKAGASIANVLKGNRKTVTVQEGNETAPFWSALGGKGAYASEGFLYDQQREPRLFSMSNASGVFRVEEIFSFSQDDLDPDDVFLLDSYNQVFVWVGDRSNEIEKALSFETAVKYVQEVGDGRSLDTPIIKVHAGHEPHMFTCHFLGWDSVKASKKEDPVRAKLRSLGGDAGSSDVREAVKTYTSDKKYSFEELKKRPLPPGVDVALLERYLQDSEFPKAFGMSRDEFDKLQAWKKVQKKKQAGLF